MKNQRAIPEAIGKSQIGSECSICTQNFEPGHTVKVFACHETHMLHAECYAEMVKFSLQTRVAVICPICRSNVETDKIVTKKLQKADEEDPFNRERQDEEVKERTSTPQNKNQVMPEDIEISDKL